MSGEYDDVQLGELYEFGSGLSKPREEFGFGYPFVSFKDVFDNFFLPDQLNQLVNSTPEERDTCSIRRGDVLLTRTSETLDELGMSCTVLHDVPGATFNGFTKRLRPKNDLIYPEYAAYFFRSSLFRRQIFAMSNMSTRASLNNEMLGRLSFRIRAHHEQIAIGQTLKALDDKIELNRRTAETLEEMARALFKSWFIDFDPVHAKAEGRPTSLADELSASFPDKFNQGGLPNGWRRTAIVESFDLSGGGTPKTSISKYWNGHIPWFSVVDAPINSLPFVLKTDRRITELGLENCASPLLPEGATIVTARGTVGKLAIVGLPMAMNQSCYAAVSKAGYSNYFVYFLIKNAIDDLKTKSHGSVFSTITRQTFDNVNAALPPPMTAANYDRAAAPLMDKIKLLIQQSHVLADMRDALLLKLISGELNIVDAEKQIAVA